jgi:DNA polymerase III subunit alpha
VLLAIQTGNSLKDPTGCATTARPSTCAPAGDEQLFAEIPEALSNTIEIAERCEVDLGFKGYHLPDFDVPEGFTAETYLRHLCEIGRKALR